VGVFFLNTVYIHAKNRWQAVPPAATARH